MLFELNAHIDINDAPYYDNVEPYPAWPVIDGRSKSYCRSSAVSFNNPLGWSHLIYIKARGCGRDNNPQELPEKIRCERKFKTVFLWISKLRSRTNKVILSRGTA